MKPTLHLEPGQWRSDRTGRRYEATAADWIFGLIVGGIPGAIAALVIYAAR